MSSVTNIDYHPSNTPNPLHQFDLYVPLHTSSSSSQHSLSLPPLICFVHGGAWRSEDKADHAVLARRLAAQTACPVAVPNYRLTTPGTPFNHPTHAEDLLAFLNFVISWSGEPKLESPCYDPSKLILMGHSCSAHMLTSIFLSPSPTQNPCPSLVPSSTLISSVKAIIISEGIYNVDTLLQSFPTYKEWFIASTFTDLSSYSDFNTTDYVLHEGAEEIKWFVVHSTGDTLVDILQSQEIVAHLQEIVPGGENVHHDFTTLVAEHNTILKEDFYPQMVANYVSTVL